jgi:hypothetical protein
VVDARKAEERAALALRLGAPSSEDVPAGARLEQIAEILCPRH